MYGVVGGSYNYINEHYEGVAIIVQCFWVSPVKRGSTPSKTIAGYAIKTNAFVHDRCQALSLVL